MTHEVSVFIMDISASSQSDKGSELSDYLDDIIQSINTWTEETVTLKVSHRAGDEVVLITDGISSAYILAFYISRIWKYTDTPPYFGITAGRIDEAIHDIDIDTWIHPLMKDARAANDYLKQQKKRGQFHFKWSESNTPLSAEAFNRLINSNILLNQSLINDQTDIQFMVCSLYLILNQQNKVSDYLDRTTATISHHMKQGKTQIILDAFNTIVAALESCAQRGKAEVPEELQSNIRHDITIRLDEYFK